MKTIIKLINLFLLIICCVISSLLFINKDINLSSSNKIFSFFTNFIKLEGNFLNVSNNLNYINIDQYTYTNYSSCIYSPYKASVIEVKDERITLRCDNDYILVFEDVININVNKLDVVNVEDKLANFIENYSMYVIINGEKVSYESINKYNW